jgi:diadenosine tetraphosphate (Ap4A) HIT family hydrolase
MSVACVFCEIVRGAEPASVVWEDDLTMAFWIIGSFIPATRW